MTNSTEFKGRIAEIRKNGFEVGERKQEIQKRRLEKERK